MTQTKPGEPSIRRAARQAAVAAQARQRAKTAERDKRLDAAALTLIITLNNATPSIAGPALRSGPCSPTGSHSPTSQPGPTARPPTRKPPGSPSLTPRTKSCHEHSTPCRWQSHRQEQLRGALADMKPTSAPPGRDVKGDLIRIIPVLVGDGARNWATLPHREGSEV